MRCCEVRCFPREVCFVRRPLTSFYCSNDACGSELCPAGQTFSPPFRTSLWRITTVCRRLDSTIPLKIYLPPNKTQFAVPKRRSIIKAPFPALKLHSSCPFLSAISNCVVSPKRRLLLENCIASSKRCPPRKLRPLARTPHAVPELHCHVPAKTNTREVQRSFPEKRRLQSLNFVSVVQNAVFLRKISLPNTNTPFSAGKRSQIKQHTVF
jgi:hypothetical protein